MVQQLKSTETYITTTEQEAIDFINEQKTEFNVVEHGVKCKYNKKNDVEYFIVKIVKEFASEKDVVEALAV